MQRIYFDKQIFSHLYNGKDDIYKNLLSELLKYKDDFLYCFSHAHMLDLKNDKTEIKFKELEFMETLVDDNYLSYHAIEKRTSCYLATPTETFKGNENEEKLSFENVFDTIDTSYLTNEQKVQFQKAKEILTTQTLDFGFLQTNNLSEEILTPLSKILPIDTPKMTIMEWVQHFMSILKNMEEDKTIYKELRKVVDAHLNNGKFSIDYDSIDFNDDLKNSVLQKSFIEYVNGNINPNGDKEISRYDFFTNAYFTLDLLGISKEPSKKVKFRNVLNDGFHSYYGAYCDLVVSDDDGFLKKTRALYRLLGIKTQVFHINEFISHFALMTKSIESNSGVFFNLLKNDLTTGMILNTWPSLRRNRQTTTIKTFHNYLGHFNHIDVVKEPDQEFIFLSRHTENYSNFDFFRDTQKVVNRAVKIFGTDKYFRGEYDWEKENEELKNDNWHGRIWELDSLRIIIEINKGTNEFCLIIVPIK